MGFLRILAVRLHEELTRQLFSCNAAATLRPASVSYQAAVQHFEVEADQYARRDELLKFLFSLFFFQAHSSERCTDLELWMTEYVNFDSTWPIVMDKALTRARFYTEVLTDGERDGAKQSTWQSVVPV